MQKRESILREEKAVMRIICNGCGREIPLEGTDYFHGEKRWGYFSAQDGRQDSFDLCEGCYAKLVEGFVVPMEE